MIASKYHAINGYFDKDLSFHLGFIIVVLTIFSALSTFVLTRAARSQLNRIVFGVMRKLFEFILKFVPLRAA